MNKIGKTGVSLMVLSAFVFAPIASHAQLDANLTGDAKAQVDSAVDANVDANTNVDTSVDTDSSINSETNINSDTKANVGSENRSEATMNGSLRINSLGVAITSSSQVKNDEDLEIFSSNLSAEEDVAKVEIESDDDESEIEVVYKHRGRLFGFIPITLKSTTIVEAKSNSEIEVRAKMPWWAFLVAKKNYVKSELETKVKNNSTVKANASVNSSAEAKAKVAEAVIAEVAAHANAQAKVNK